MNEPHRERVEHKLIFGYPILWIGGTRDDHMTLTVANNKLVQIVILIDAVHGPVGVKQRRM